MPLTFDEVIAPALARYENGFEPDRAFARQAYENNNPSFWGPWQYHAAKHVSALEALNRYNIRLSAAWLIYLEHTPYINFLSSLIPLNHAAAIALWRAYEDVGHSLLLSNIIDRRLCK